jgi:hypothetical protein
MVLEHARIVWEGETGRFAAKAGTGICSPAARQRPPASHFVYDWGQSAEQLMNVVLPGCLGLLLGAIVGGALGVGAGLLWTNVFHTTSFEGYSGMLVFFTFMPIGIIAGGLIGGVGLGVLASRGSTSKRE